MQMNEIKKSAKKLDKQIQSHVLKEDESCIEKNTKKPEIRSSAGCKELVDKPTDRLVDKSIQGNIIEESEERILMNQRTE